MSPERWPTVTLGAPTVAKISSGGTPSRSKSEYFGGDILWVKSGDLNDSVVVDSDECLTQDGLQSSAAKLLPAGTVLVAMYGATVGKTAILGRPATTNQAVCSIRPHPDVFNPWFLQYLLMHWRPTLLAERYGGAQPNISQTIVSALNLPCPRLGEQRKIAAVLWKLQRATTTQDRLVAVTRDLKQAAMQRLFTYGARREQTRETRYGAVPRDWSEKPLGDCCTVQTGVTKGRRIPADEAVEVPYLRVANVQDGHLDLREVKTITIRRRELSRFQLQPGDVVLTEGGDFDKLGRGFVWHGQIPVCVHQNHVFAVRTNRDPLIPEFLAYLAQSPYGKAYFLEVAHKTTNLASINSTKLKAFPVLLPDLDEQREIANALDTIDRKLAHHQRKRAALNNLFQTALHQLMTAQIRVADLDIDPSEVTTSIEHGEPA